MARLAALLLTMLLSGNCLAEEGTASVYHDRFEGRRTASGDTFSQSEMTAASKTLPLGSKAVVENERTGEKATVKITDRGPYAKGRKIDLSKKAAKRIGMNPGGVARVKITPLPGSK